MGRRRGEGKGKEGRRKEEGGTEVEVFFGSFWCCVVVFELAFFLVRADNCMER